MPRYIVQRAYHSDVATYAVGQVVEIADLELAAWFNRDLPGVLKLIEPPAPAPPAALIERHIVEAPAASETHMVDTRPARKRRGRG